jgi:hypothetical protein
MSDPMVDAAQDYVESTELAAEQAHVSRMIKILRRDREIGDTLSSLKRERRVLELEVAAAIGVEVGQEIEDIHFGRARSPVAGKVTSILSAGVELSPTYRHGSKPLYLARVLVEVAPMKKGGGYHKTQRRKFHIWDDEQLIFAEDCFDEPACRIWDAEA